MVLGIILILASLLMPAVQSARESARRVACSSNVRQLGIANHLFHDAHLHLPAGQQSATGTKPFLSWLGETLPFVEQRAIAEQISHAYTILPNPFNNATHMHASTPIAAFSCPSDGRAEQPHNSRGYTVALTNYVGVAGISIVDGKGTFFVDSAVRFSDITDGLSNTVMLGERPPSPDMFFGWWYAGYASRLRGAYDSTLGVRSENLTEPGELGAICELPFYKFSQSDLYDYCNPLHFWSLHPHGGYFAFADGATRFLTYTGEEVLPEMSTIAGAEVPRQSP